MHIPYIASESRYLKDCGNGRIDDLFPKVEEYLWKRSWIKWCFRLRMRCWPCIYSFQQQAGPGKHFLLDQYLTGSQKACSSIVRRSNSKIRKQSRSNRHQHRSLVLPRSKVMDEYPPPPDDALDTQTPPPPPQPRTIHTGSPTDFLKGVVGKKVIVRLNSGVDYRGSRLPRFLFSSFLCPDALIFRCMQEFSHVLMDTWTLLLKQRRNTSKEMWQIVMVMHLYEEITVSSLLSTLEYTLILDPVLYISAAEEIW